MQAVTKMHKIGIESGNIAKKQPVTFLTNFIACEKIKRLTNTLNN